MIQELYQKAMRYAGEKHAHQTVPGTKANYLLHISNVTMEVIIAHKMDPCFDLGFAVEMAILHDTIEDTDASWEEIREIFGEGVADGVQALTKNQTIESKSEQLVDSLNRIKQLDKEVGLVKLADRITNLQAPPNEWSNEKITKYQVEATLILHELNESNVYLSARLQKKINEYSKYIKE
ncbi:HD domain-containing protein [Paracrocinitomix mangrovi]|uniref:HD domain-containing protein n=1 Tax=Paracrocinitomix mangrovi TaxID=2862509 RepID=UPI001C8E00FC|nr:HD domain-containing protein [Paracrocinitomix mangrovi]UKN03603.1 HD domain-containing protein [Paracrocinitomix mangrovi]